MSMPLQTSPVTNVLLPPGSKEHRRYQLVSFGMFAVNPLHPFCSSDLVCKMFPKRPNLRRIWPAVFHANPSSDYPMDFFGMLVYGVNDWLDHLHRRFAGSRQQEVLEEIRHGRL